MRSDVKCTGRRVANLKEDEMEILNSSLGIYIIERLVMDTVDKELYKSCCAVYGNNNLSEEEGAFVIIDKLWKRLQETHKLRMVE